MTTKRELEEAIEFLENAVNSVPVKYFNNLDMVLDEMKDDLEDME